MFINKLNQLYKPDRILYYLDATDKEIAQYYQGDTPEVIKKYENAFGTYDYPGVFFVASLGKEVLGIEYRPSDDRIDYPKDLKAVDLKGAFFYSVEIDEEVDINRGFIKDLFDDIAKNSDAHRLYSDLYINEDPGVVAVFLEDGKLRILHEWNIIDDRASLVIEDKAQDFTRDYLYRTAFFDPITSHYNWNHLVAFLEMPMDKGISDYAFVHFDIKEFRVINEVYGHIAANRVLCNVVKAMNDADFVYASARCHNDNFAMMIKDMPEDEILSTLGDFFERLSHLDADPNYRIYYRAGVVPMQRAMLSGNRVADAGKMAQALGTSHNNTEIIIYTDKMHNDISWGNYIKAYVETAIDQDEFVVFLQPKFDLKKNKVKGSEALIRWNYKNKEFLPPSRFIPFFEKDGTISKIDDIVLRKVCEAFDRWKKAGKALYPISVNLSRDRLYDVNLIDHLTGIVDSYDVDHSLIDFELTESASYDNTEQMIRVLNDLRSRGFRISMDDFGTGYSSFSLLTQMPIDTLKIDKSFVDKVGTDDEKAHDIVVIKHIIALAKELDFVCLAEGAEKKCQVDKLRQLGCEVIQGYYYSRPVPVDEYEENYLSRNSLI